MTAECCDLCGGIDLRDHCDKLSQPQCNWKRCRCGAYGVPGKRMVKLSAAK